MRFQPRLGRFLAAAAENVVSILDVETQACRYSLKVGSNRNLKSLFVGFRIKSFNEICISSQIWNIFHPIWLTSETNLNKLIVEFHLR